MTILGVLPLFPKADDVGGAPPVTENTVSSIGVGWCIENSNRTDHRIEKATHDGSQPNELWIIAQLLGIYVHWQTAFLHISKEHI